MNINSPISNLIPNVVCRNVTIPHTKNKVEKIYALATSVVSIHSFGHNKNGIEIMPPIIVKMC